VNRRRDLKPSNVLLNADCTLRLCDFGLARGVHVPGADMTEYVVTRWYRAPEVMLATQQYTTQIDMWAIGCIMAELLGRRPLFPGDDYIHQLRLIVDVLGSPSDSDLEFVTSSRAKAFMKRQTGKQARTLASVLPKASTSALSFLSQLLVLNPAKRLTVDEALCHPYLADLHDVADEFTCKHEFDFGFELLTLSKADIQLMMLQDVCVYHPEARAKYAELEKWEAESPAATSGLPKPEEVPAEPAAGTTTAAAAASSATA
jgi:mitogen-activated protein kinase 1/3